MPRFIFALMFVIAGANILNPSFKDRYHIVLPEFLNDGTTLLFFGGFLFLYGLRIAIKGWPDIQKGYQLFILGPLIVICCELVVIIGILLIKVNTGFAPLNALFSAFGVSLFLGGISYAVLRRWNERTQLLSIY